MQSQLRRDQTSLESSRPRNLGTQPSVQVSAVRPDGMRFWCGAGQLRMRRTENRCLKTSTVGSNLVFE